MHIVNTNYKTKITPIDIKKVHGNIKHSKLYVGKPNMLKIKKYNACLLLFRSGSIRIMGRENHDKLLQKVISKIPNVKQLIPLELMSHTVVHQINSLVNLHILDPYKFFSNQELFPAVIYRHNSNEHANIFASGKIVITGSKSINNVKQLIINIEKDLENGCYTRY